LSFLKQGVGIKEHNIAHPRAELKTGIFRMLVNVGSGPSAPTDLARQVEGPAALPQVCFEPKVLDAAAWSNGGFRDTFIPYAYFLLTLGFVRLANFK